METWLVTGGAGFIGSNFVHLVRRLSRARIINLDKLTYAGHLESLEPLKDDPDHIFVRGDIGNVELVFYLLSTYRVTTVVNFAAGGIATPADAALMMQLGMDGVFVGSGIFKSGDPARRAAAIVKAVTHYNEPKILAEISRNLGEPMVGRQISAIPEHELIAGRGW